MSDPHDLVKEWHLTYGVPVGTTPSLLTDRLSLRLGLIEEEWLELAEAVESQSLIETLDALGDMVYVIYGMAIEMGVNLSEVLDEIQRSNMSKLGHDGNPIYREDGKVLKGPNYTPPDIASVLFK